MTTTPSRSTSLVTFETEVHSNERYFNKLLEGLRESDPLIRVRSVFMSTQPRNNNHKPQHGDTVFSLLTEGELTAEKLGAALDQRRMPGFADNSLFHSAMSYLATQEYLRWLQQFEQTLSQDGYAAYIHLIQLDVDCHDSCQCQSGDNSSLATTWLHAHHGLYNTLVHRLIEHHDMMLLLQEEWKRQNNLPADCREANQWYHSRLYGFLKNTPRREWFHDPAPVA